MKIITKTMYCTTLAIALAAAGSAQAQLTPNLVPFPTGISFSIDFQGPTVGGSPFAGGIPDSFVGSPIDAGDILTVAPPGSPGPNPEALGPLPVPGTMIDSTGFVSSFGATLGLASFLPGGQQPAPREVDAMSYGFDALFGADQISTQPPDTFSGLVFSVDEWAAGYIPPASPFPSVNTEGASGSSEASADIQRYLGPVSTTGAVAPIGHVTVVDGNGTAPYGGPGLGLIEPNPASPGTDPGDNLDAMDVDTLGFDPSSPVYFSMDSAFVDPREGTPNSGTALANGFVGGDVVVSSPAGGAPSLYVPAIALGLDLLGTDTDDLDALVLNDALDDVIGTFTPGIDQILFSVRSGSAIIGTPDSLYGLPIQPGDVLTLPVTCGAAPSIFITAEALGLGTLRPGFTPTTNQNFADDLDALDVADFFIPEPSSLILIGLGGLGLLRRRRA